MSNIPIHIELIINVEDFFIEGNYRMTVIEADATVESMISELLKKHYYNNFPPAVQ
jgi:hypothetical protein